MLLVLQRDAHERPHGLQRIARCVGQRAPERGSEILGVAHQYSRPVAAVFKMLNHLIHHPITEATHFIGGIERTSVGSSSSGVPKDVARSRHDPHSCAESFVENCASNCRRPSSACAERRPVK